MTTNRIVIDPKIYGGKLCVRGTRITVMMVLELLEQMIDTHFKFYKQVDANPEFAETLTKFLFERYRRSLGVAGT